MIPDKSSLLMSESKYNVSRVADIFYFRSSGRSTKESPRATPWTLVVVQSCAVAAILRATY